VTPEAEERLTKAERFLSQAMGLSARAAPEAIIHLTYYAMLHAAAAVVVERLGRTPKTHGGIIGQFAQLTRAEGENARSFGRALNRAEDIRLMADYAYDTAPEAADASAARKAAVPFVAYCRSLL
jgi:uncharacterized protein (UPF0332 family)